MKKHIPNIITLLNLFCGCCAIVCFLYGNYTQGALWLLLSAIADFFDGMVARLLHVSGEMGKELDSLADMVSFGVAPGMALYMLLANKPSLYNVEMEGNIIPMQLVLSATPAFIVTLFSCLRLAKFNLDTRQSENFIGLATPSSTIFVVGLLFIQEANTFGMGAWVSSDFFIYGVIAALSFLLVSEIPMFSLKLKSKGWQGNELRFVFLLIAIGLLLWLHAAALSFIILIYIILNIIFFKEK